MTLIEESLVLFGSFGEGTDAPVRKCTDRATGVDDQRPSCAGDFLDLGEVSGPDDRNHLIQHI